MKKCFVCYENKTVMAVGECNHIESCIECCFKMRFLDKNTRCLICNFDQFDVIASSDTKKLFEDYDMSKLTKFHSGILIADVLAGQQCKNLFITQCPLKNCVASFKDKKKYMEHLSKTHDHHLCNICMENRIILLRDQQIYNKAELHNHLNLGDFDDNGSLIALHPLCVFCGIRFFNDEMLKRHMKIEHMQCHLCKEKDREFVFYENYPVLEGHFQHSHFLCPKPQCIQTSFIVFDTRDKLNKHLREVHKEKPKGGMAIKMNDIRKEDSLGHDIKNNLLEYIKEKGSSRLDFDCVNADKRIRMIDYFRFLKKSNDGPITLERVKFPLYPQRMAFADFEKNLEEKLSFDQRKKLLKKVLLFNKKQDTPKTLFTNFIKIFGNVDVYYYFYLFTGTVKKNNIRNLLYDTLDEQMEELPFAEKNLLNSVRTWPKLFSMISDEIDANIVNRLQLHHMDSLIAYPMRGDSLKQFLSKVKTMRFGQTIEFGCLIEFLKQEKAKQYLIDMLTDSACNSQKHLCRIASFDILLLSLYFNLVKQKFTGKTLPVAKELNQNLLKVFLRRHIDITQFLDYDLASDSDDDGCPKQNYIEYYKNENKPPIDNKANFPTLPKVEKPKEEPKKKPEKTHKTLHKEDSFPELAANEDAGRNLLSNLNVVSKKKKKNLDDRFQYKKPDKIVKKETQEQKQVGGIMVRKAKKKKKKKWG